MANLRTALITGATGQDGAYLAEFLLSKGYQVLAGFRRTSTKNEWRFEKLGLINHPNLEFVQLDVTDFPSVCNLFLARNIDEVYNLAAQSFVGVSFEQPILTANATGLGAVNLLEAIRQLRKDTRFYQASTSEMFGGLQHSILDENSNFNPRSPYAAAKVYAHNMTELYRSAYGLHASAGILFNHESPLRGEEFVTRKISIAVAKIALGESEVLKLGNLDAKRDWGYAGDYVKGMWAMVQREVPETYVLATSNTISVRDFVTMSFKAAGIEISFEGSNQSEVGLDSNSGKKLVEIDPVFYRPAEVEFLLGSYSKAQSELGWTPDMNVEELSRIMVTSDIQHLQNSRAIP